MGIEVKAVPKIIAFVGNPNVGKSTIFNGLTGLRQHTGNWPGKTVSNAQGSCLYNGKEFEFIDLPGCYSLYPHSAEEEVTGEFLKSGKADLVMVVCDAGCLERNLNLLLQVLEITDRAVVCVNLMDEAEKKGISVDLNKLSAELGVPVVGTSASRGIGLDRLLKVLDEMTENMEGGSIKGSLGPPSEERIRGRIDRAEEISRKVVRFSRTDYDRRDRKLDRIFTSKLTGFPIMFLLLALIFWITIQGANVPSQFLSEKFHSLEIVLNRILIEKGAPVWLQGALIDGIYRVATWVIAVMLPPMAIFFPLFTLLEDFGYLPRIAFNLDRCFQRCRACGKQALTTCMGFGCNAVGVTGCRIIDSPRERLIAMLTNSFIPCNGRFPALIALLLLLFAVRSEGGGAASIAAVFALCGLIALSVLMSLLASRFLSETILKGEPSSFALELPPYRKPQIGKVIVRSLLDRTLFVLGRAVVVAAPAGLLIWIFANVPVGGVSLLTVFTEFLDPFARIIGLDGVILGAFILGLPANEIVLPIIMMTYLAQGTLIEAGDLQAMGMIFEANGWTWVTVLCTMVFYLMHWPCATTLLTIRKESGSWRWVGVSILIPAMFGMGLCFLINLIGTAVM